VAALRILSRFLALLWGASLLAVGALGLGMAYAPQHELVEAGRAQALRGVESAMAALGPSPAAEAAMAAGREAGEAAAEEALALLAGPVPRHALPALGLGLVLFALWPRRRIPQAEATAGDDDAPAPASAPKVDRSTRRRVERQAKDLVKRDRVREAAELYLNVDLCDRAVELFLQCGEVQRAAEVRHDENRFEEAAELFLRAERFEQAAAIYAERELWEPAAEAFLEAGRRSMAAEMYAKAGLHAKAAQAFQDSGFQRHAAQAWVRCQRWERAAACLEEVIAEESPHTATADPKKVKEVRTLVLQCGRLWEQAGEPARSVRVLERGGCWLPAAELALRLKDPARAAELFRRAGETLRAAEALRAAGEERAAAQLLGEHYRDQGEDERAAEAFEEAGDFLSAGDLYRKLQQHARAGTCYERNHDALQAAEMFRLAGEPARAAGAFEQCQRFAEAAECWGEAGDSLRQAEMLVRAGRFLAAGEIYHAQDRQDEAIKVLQKVEAGSPELSRASALLGRIFKDRGMFSLSIKKLRQAIGDAELSPENIDAFHMLALVYDANRQFRDAVDLYEKILACDYHYADVAERLEAAREKLRLQEMREGSTPGSGASGSSSLTPSGASRYQIVAELGRGGMGIVYRAQDTVLDRMVAYKVLPDALKENPQALRNFLREAKSAAQLNHPNIVTVYDAGEQDGRYYIAMEYVDGTTLKEILKRRGAIAPGGVMHVLAQMCEALAYAHERKIVHRDIKSANTMWTRDKKAKIMDFGLAKVLEEVRNHTTLVSGTPYYMSPEQTLGKNVDHRTDLYSLGVTLFELCTGRLPFVEGNIPYHHVHSPPPDVREVNPRVPPVLARIVSRCMQKAPEDRYGSAREILAELKAARGRRS